MWEHQTWNVTFKICNMQKESVRPDFWTRLEHVLLLLIMHLLCYCTLRWTPQATLASEVFLTRLCKWEGSVTAKVNIVCLELAAPATWVIHKQSPSQAIQSKIGEYVWGVFMPHFGSCASRLATVFFIISWKVWWNVSRELIFWEKNEKKIRFWNLISRKSLDGIRCQALQMVTSLFPSPVW